MKARNRTILISLVSLTILIAGYHVFLRLKETSEQKIKFHVFEYSNNNILNSYFRKIPALYDNSIKIERTNRFNKDYTLYKVDNDIYGGTPSIHYLILNKDNGRITELKSASLLNRIKDFDDFNWDTYHSYLIDLNEFNYVYSSQQNKADSLIDNYARLLADINDSIHFRKINSIRDIALILKNLPKDTYNVSSVFESELIENYDFLNSIDENEKYYWFYDRGIVRFEFIINENKEFEKMESNQIGFIGNEIIHW